jgi:hypothetical protein
MEGGRKKKDSITYIVARTPLDTTTPHGRRKEEGG